MGPQQETSRMTVAEAATKLEVKTTVIYALCKAKLLGHHRVGLGRGSIRISQADVDIYVRSRRVDPEEPGHRHAPERTGLAVRDYIGEAMAEEARRAVAPAGQR